MGRKGYKLEQIINKLREPELLGLQWRNVDLDTLSISQAKCYISVEVFASSKSQRQATASAVSP